jgi:tetratricopeptide (TPR) repeat protein
MPTFEERYDDAMFDFSRGDYDSAIAKLKRILAEDATYFDAQLSLGMAQYRKGDYVSAIAEGRKAETLRPHEQLVHTNLSLFYLKRGDKTMAEHHGLQARIASWKTSGSPSETPGASPGLEQVKSKPPPGPAAQKFPEMPWKKKAKIGGGDAPAV